MQMNSQSCWPALCCAMVHVVVRSSPRSCESSSSDTCRFTSAPIGWNSCPNFLKQLLGKCSDSSFVESPWRQVKGATSEPCAPGWRSQPGLYQRSRCLARCDGHESGWFSFRFGVWPLHSGEGAVPDGATASPKLVCPLSDAPPPGG